MASHVLFDAHGSGADLIVPVAPISSDHDFSCAVCFVPPVRSDSLLYRLKSAGDWMIQYSAPRYAMSKSTVILQLVSR